MFQPLFTSWENYSSIFILPFLLLPIMIMKVFWLTCFVSIDIFGLDRGKPLPSSTCLWVFYISQIKFGYYAKKKFCCCCFNVNFQLFHFFQVKKKDKSCTFENTHSVLNLTNWFQFMLEVENVKKSYLFWWDIIWIKKSLIEEH